MSRPVRLTWSTATLATLVLSGCSSILGIESPMDGDTSTGGGSSSGGKSSSVGGNDGAGGATPGSGATASNGGSASTGGGSGAGGRSGTGGESSGSGGSPNDGGMAGDEGSGGDGAGGSGGAGGSAGAGATGGTGGGSPTLHGRIVDLFGRPMAYLQIGITGGKAALTDDQGAFTIEDAPPTYDAEFRISARDGYYLRTYRFVGLTRRDPTFQVDYDVGNQEARVDVQLTNLPAPQLGDLGAAVGNPIGTAFDGDESGTDGTVALDYDGQDPFPTTLHALFWSNAGGATEFFAEASQMIALNDGEVTEVILDNWTPTSVTGQLAGHIDVPGAGPDVEVAAYCNFSDGASIPLQTDTWNASNQTFSLTVPDLGSAATFSVSACTRDEGYACAHADGFTIGSAAMSIDLTVPRRPFLQNPIDGATDVTADTVFTWTPSTEGPCSLVLINNGFWTHGLRVVTCESELIVGTELLGSFFLFGEEIYFSVQSYGAPQSADEMTGPDGFFDPYYDGLHSGTYARGKTRPLQGTFTRSEFRMLSFTE